MTQLRPVSLTPDALEQVKAIMESKAVPDGYGLRIGVKSSGCAGLGFMLGFDKIAENDMSYDEQGVLVIIEKKHAMYLAGKKLIIPHLMVRQGLFLKKRKNILLLSQTGLL